jgi:hypothetical protein
VFTHVEAEAKETAFAQRSFVGGSMIQIVNVPLAPVVEVILI